MMIDSNIWGISFLSMCVDLIGLVENVACGLLENGRSERKRHPFLVAITVVLLLYSIGKIIIF